MFYRGKFSLSKQESCRIALRPLEILMRDRSEKLQLLNRAQPSIFKVSFLDLSSSVHIENDLLKNSQRSFLKH